MNDFKEWLKSAAEDSGTKIASSSVYAGIVTDEFLKDPLCALQLGYAIILNKPIMLIVDNECKVPESLVKIAKVIERVDVKKPEDMRRATESLQSMISKI